MLTKAAICPLIFFPTNPNMWETGLCYYIFFLEQTHVFFNLDLKVCCQSIKKTIAEEKLCNWPDANNSPGLYLGIILRWRYIIAQFSKNTYCLPEKHCMFCLWWFHHFLPRVIAKNNIVAWATNSPWTGKDARGGDHFFVVVSLICLPGNRFPI